MEYKKKYVQYQIIIGYVNGDRETITHKDSFNDTSYKDMLKLYNQTKKEFSDNCKTIEFVGVTDSKETNILFQKNIMTDDLRIKEKAEEFQNTSGLTLIKELVNAIEKISEKQNQLGNNLNVLNKKEDLLLHINESNGDINEKQKSEWFDKVHQIRKERRIIKNDIEILRDYFEKLNGETMDKINLTHIKNISRTFICKTEHVLNNIKNKYQPLTETKIQELKMMEEFTYRDFKDKMRLMRELQSQGKYSKIVQDDVKMVIICYNRAYKDYKQSV